MSQPEVPLDHDFSLVVGGPFYQLYVKAHLGADAWEAMRIRILVLAGVAWVPLLILSLIEGRALGGGLKIPFLYDIDQHVRFLVALPILIGAELIVHRRMRPSVQQFIERGIVPTEEVPKYQAIVQSVMGMRNSLFVELGLAIFVYTVGFWSWRNQIVTGTATWYAIPDGDTVKFTLAGYWASFVSIPIFQFLLARWYMRFCLWFVFLWRVSRLNLRLIPTHPDRVGGMSFLGRSTYAFAPILFAQGTLLAGLLANQIFYGGKNLQDFKAMIFVFTFTITAAVLAPLTVFISQLVNAQRKGMADYGRVATRYSREFEAKWFQGGATPEEPLLGSADLQSHADLGNSFAVVAEMRVLPFTLKDVTRLAIYALIPLAPLLLTIFSAEELVSQLFKVLF